MERIFSLAPRAACARARRPFATRARGHRRGVAVTEFAVVAPVFILFVFGLLECGRMVMVQQVLTNASREGARRAVLEGATQSEVETQVATYLSNCSVSGATVNCAPSNLSTAGFGDSVTVTVTIPFDSVCWTVSPFYFREANLSASTMMQAERLQ